jgi:hypothetical protein
MKILPSQSEIQARTANPSVESLRGYSIDRELRAAVKAAVKPVAKRLAHYRAEVSRIQANCDKWSADAYTTKLNEITARAHAGDAEAANAIETGAVPSRQSYAEMHNRAALELEQCHRDNRALFAEVLPLVEGPMTAVVNKGQEILDAVLNGLGVPTFHLTGWVNHNGYIFKQLAHASRNESADLDWFWDAIN